MKKSTCSEKVNDTKNIPNTGIFFCKNCGREFKTLGGVTRHEKKCFNK